MKQYLDLLKEVMENGVDRPDRTGVGTRSVFGRQMKFDLRQGFPMVTTKRVSLRQVGAELLWFLSGSSDIRELHLFDVHIWDNDVYCNEWQDQAVKLGLDRFDAGRNYSKQWREWKGPEGKLVDQLAQADWLIKNQPESRRIIVNAWNPSELDLTALPPCHRGFQFYITNGRLDLVMDQRSADMCLGVPYNISSYAVLLHLFAQWSGLEAGVFTHNLDDTHIYSNHFDGVAEQVKRDPYPLPRLWLNPELNSLEATVFAFEQIKKHARKLKEQDPAYSTAMLIDRIFKVEGYNYHSDIRYQWPGDRWTAPRVKAI